MPHDSTGAGCSGDIARRCLKHPARFALKKGDIIYMIKTKQRKAHRFVRRCWQVAFGSLLAAVLVFEASPELSASALYLLTDGASTVVADGTEPVDAGRILLTGAESGEADVILEPDRKVMIRQGERVFYATSRAGESVSELLQREGIAVGPLEMVRADLSAEGGVLLEIASDFTYYETVREAAAYTTVYAADHTLPKGETKVTQTGQDGTRDVTYEVVYADGAFVSRQAVAETGSTAVAETVSVGTLVKEAQSGDAIASIIYSDDGGGYLILESGDSLHFTHTMEVKCTAYTSGYDGVGTRTYSGTTVHTGVVAVDKSVIDLGTRMFITTADGSFTYGMGVAEDTGVRGKVVDLFMDTYDECIRFGRRSSILYFLDP